MDGAYWRRLGGILERLGGVLMELLGALLKAIWTDAENVEKQLVFLAFGALAALGGVLEAT